MRAMTLFKNKYRVESTRLPGWDYGNVGYYYVTICTKDRAHFFGDVVAEDVVLSAIGEIVADEWLKTECLRDNVRLDAWMIMPNHMHLILVITYRVESVGEGGTFQKNKTPQRGVSTGVASEKWAGNTVGSIVGQFKGACTKRIWAEGFNEFAWQPRFFDRIIRSEDELHRARHYIASNPVNWDKDRDNMAGLYM